MNLLNSLLSIILIAVVVKTAADVLVAFYGRDKGYPFFPLFVAASFLSFPVVLLVVTIVAARKDRA
jgi:cation transporter-like permease